MCAAISFMKCSWLWINFLKVMHNSLTLNGISLSISLSIYKGDYYPLIVLKNYLIRVLPQDTIPWGSPILSGPLAYYMSTISSRYTLFFFFENGDCINCSEKTLQYKRTILELKSLTPRGEQPTKKEEPTSPKIGQ